MWQGTMALVPGINHIPWRVTQPTPLVCPLGLERLSKTVATIRSVQRFLPPCLTRHTTVIVRTAVFLQFPQYLSNTLCFQNASQKTQNIRQCFICTRQWNKEHKTSLVLKSSSYFNHSPVSFCETHSYLQY